MKTAVSRGRATGVGREPKAGVVLVGLEPIEGRSKERGDRKPQTAHTFGRI